MGGNDIPMALSSSVSGNLANQSLGELIAQNNSILSALLVDYEWETVETLPEAVELMEIETYIEVEHATDPRSGLNTNKEANGGKQSGL